MIQPRTSPSPVREFNFQGLQGRWITNRSTTRTTTVRGCPSRLLCRNIGADCCCVSAGSTMDQKACGVRGCRGFLRIYYPGPRSQSHGTYYQYCSVLLSFTPVSARPCTAQAQSGRKKGTAWNRPTSEELAILTNSVPARKRGKKEN